MLLCGSSWAGAEIVGFSRGTCVRLAVTGICGIKCQAEFSPHAKVCNFKVYFEYENPSLLTRVGRL